MKKLIILVTMIMVIGLSACADSPTPYDDTELLNRIIALEEENLQAQIDTINVTLDEFELYDDSDVFIELAVMESLLNTLALNYQDLLTSDIALQADIDSLELAILEVTTRIDNLVVTTGINGITSVYENPTDQSAISQTPMEMLIASVEMLKDTLDKTKCPAYMLDEFDEYISYEQMMRRLNDKYFDLELQYLTEFDVGLRAYARFQFTATERSYLDEFDIQYQVEITNEEMIARTILMIEELRLYAAYIISYPELYIEVFRDDGIGIQQFYISIPVATSLADYVTITPDGIYDSDYEMELFIYGDYDTVLIQQYYDEFKASGIFDGYVLNY